MFSVSTAVVKWWYRAFFGSLLTLINKYRINFWTSSIEWLLPLNWGKYQRISVSGFFTFFFSRSYLFKNKIIETLLNITLLTIVSNISRASSNLFVFLSSSSTWSNSEEDTKKSIEVTESKHWNHFCLCDRWPPTSTNRKGMLLIGIMNSVIPLVAFLQCRISLCVGE